MSRFFGKPAHTAFVVPDFEKALGRMLGSGIGPIFTLKRLKLPAIYRGVRKDAIFSAAFAISGETHFEIIQPDDDTPSAYREFLARNPQGGLHHIAYFSENFAADIARAQDSGTGFEIVQSFLTPDGPPFEVYLEPAGIVDPILIQLMYHAPTAGMFTKIERIAATWNGEAPIRNLFEMMPPEFVLPVG